MIYDLRLPYALLADLYEQIIFELVEGREVEAAGQLIAQGRTEGQDITSDQHGRAVMHRMRMDEPQRYFRLESIVRSPHFDRDQVYQEGMTRDKRRTQIARALVAQLHDAPSSRLLSLLSQALRYQQLQGVLPEGQQYDLFREVSHEQQQPELYPTRMHGQIKFPKGAFPTCAAFTPDGQSLVTGSVDGFLEVWNFATCKVRKDLAYQAADKFMIHKSAVLCVSFTVDGLFMASGDRGGNIKVWDLRTGVCVENFGKVHEKSVVALQFSKKGQKILSCSQDGTVRIHGRQSRTTLITFRGHQSYVNDCVWTHDELHAVSCSSDGTVRVWNVAQGDCVSTFHPGAGALYEATISAIALHPTQDQIFVCNHSPEIGLFSLDGKEPQKKNFVRCVTSAPQGLWLQAVTENGTISSYSVSSGEWKHTIEAHDREPTGLVRHPHRNLVASYTEGVHLKIWKPSVTQTKAYLDTAGASAASSEDKPASTPSKPRIQIALPSKK